jgi:hypothetical protein
MVREAKTVNGAYSSGSGPDDAFGAAEPRLQITLAEVSTHGDFHGGKT